MRVRRWRCVTRWLISQQVPINTSLFGSEDRFVDIAPSPDAEAAWVADQPYSERGSTNAKAEIALIGADGEKHLWIRCPSAVRDAEAPS